MAEWKDWQGKHPYYKQGFADGYNEGIGEALKPQAETAQKSSCPAIAVTAPAEVVNATRSDLARKVLETVEGERMQAQAMVKQSAGTAAYRLEEWKARVVGVNCALTALRELFEKEGVEITEGELIPGARSQPVEE